MEYKEIKQLMDDMGESKLSSLDIEFPDGVKISMTKTTEKGMSVVTAEKIAPITVEIPEVPVVQQKGNTALTNVQTQNAALVEVPNTNGNSENAKAGDANAVDLKVITSPMVGTFYASSAPDKPPYVKKGDKISKGQVVCIVEAMKLMNEIESEFDGDIVEVCVKDGDVVEYGMPLFKIKEE